MGGGDLAPLLTLRRRLVPGKSVFTVNLHAQLLGWRQNSVSPLCLPVQSPSMAQPTVSFRGAALADLGGIASLEASDMRLQAAVLRASLPEQPGGY